MLFALLFIHKLQKQKLFSYIKVRNLLNYQFYEVGIKMSSNKILGVGKRPLKYANAPSLILTPACVNFQIYCLF